MSKFRVYLEKVFEVEVGRSNQPVDIKGGPKDVEVPFEKFMSDPNFAKVRGLLIKEAEKNGIKGNSEKEIILQAYGIKTQPSDYVQTPGGNLQIRLDGPGFTIKQGTQGEEKVPLWKQQKDMKERSMQQVVK